MFLPSARVHASGPRGFGVQAQVLELTSLAEERNPAPLEVRPVTVLRLAVLLLVVANLGRIPVLDLGERQAPLLVNDLAVLAVLAIGGLAALRWRALKVDSIALAAGVFASIGLLSAIAAMPRFGLSPFEVLAGLAYLARWMVYFGLYVVVINCVKERDVESVWRALEWTMLAFVGFGIIQSVFLPNFAQTIFPESRHYVDWDPQGHRLMSTVLEPNIAAAMILTVLLVQMARIAVGAP